MNMNFCVKRSFQRSEFMFLERSWAMVKRQSRFVLFAAELHLKNYHFKIELFLTTLSFGMSSIGQAFSFK